MHGVGMSYYRKREDVERYFHTDMCSISPIFSIGRVVRILLRERKKRGKRNKRKVRPKY